jgi:protein TonB
VEERTVAPVALTVRRLQKKPAMDEKKPCVRCERAIDTWAAICPFCNQDQNAPVRKNQIAPAPVAEYRPPSEHDLKKKGLMAGAGVLLLAASFGVGMLVNRDGAPKNAPETVEQQLAEEAAERNIPPVRRADTPLVPTNEPGGIEQPITSAPVAAAPGATPDDYQRTDATAVSATEYAEMARRAKAEKEKMAVIVDPRSITGPAYQPRTSAAARPSSSANVQRAAARTTPAPTRRVTMRTRPVPEYQPLPNIEGGGRAKLSLLIGADGRVRRVDIQQPLQRRTAELVSAVQSWRFKPATENGEPVAAPYSVEIKFQ